VAGAGAGAIAGARNAERPVARCGTGRAYGGRRTSALHSGTRVGGATVSGWRSRVRAVRFCGVHRRLLVLVQVLTCCAVRVAG
jgi:hypothetical protein